MKRVNSNGPNNQQKRNAPNHRDSRASSSSSVEGSSSRDQNRRPRSIQNPRRSNNAAGPSTPTPNRSVEPIEVVTLSDSDDDVAIVSDGDASADSRDVAISGDEAVNADETINARDDDNVIVVSDDETSNGSKNEANNEDEGVSDDDTINARDDGNSSDSDIEVVQVITNHRDEVRKAGDRAPQPVVLIDLDAKLPHFFQIMDEGRNVNPIRIPKKRSDSFWQYIKMSFEERRSFWMRNIRRVEGHNDVQLFFEERIRRERRQETDPTISSRYYHEWNPKDHVLKRAKLMASRCFTSIRRVLTDTSYSQMDDIVTEYPEQLKGYDEGLKYKAPDSRIRITEDITFSSTFKIPVYSDIEGENLTEIKIPDDFLFDYIFQNIVDKHKEELLTESVKLANDERNKIECQCWSQDPIVECFKNPECPCYQMNEKLQALQKVQNPAEFHTFEPLVLDDIGAPFYNHIGFACSSSCGCGGRCTNNPEHLLRRRMFPVEIFRSNPTLGFGVRPTVFVPAGMPVMEFCGEIVDDERLDPTVTDYSMRLTDEVGDKNLYNLLYRLKNWTPEFLSILKQLSKRRFHLDCKFQGNVARFVNHSCTPNVEVMRIFQRSVTPAHMKMILYSLRAIPPGEPYTMDYGEHYGVFDTCLCSTVACMDSKFFNIFGRLSFQEMARCFSEFRENTSIRHKSSVRYERENFDEQTVEDERQDILHKKKQVVVLDDEE